AGRAGLVPARHPSLVAPLAGDFRDRRGAHPRRVGPDLESEPQLLPGTLLRGGSDRPRAAHAGGALPQVLDDLGAPPGRAGCAMSEPAPFMEHDALDALPLLVTIGVGAREELLAVAERRKYAAGQLLLAELEPGDELLIIISGRAAVTVG